MDLSDTCSVEPRAMGLKTKELGRNTSGISRALMPTQTAVQWVYVAPSLAET
jgi:hypothetical protein